MTHKGTATSITPGNSILHNKLLGYWAVRGFVAKHSRGAALALAIATLWAVGCGESPSTNNVAPTKSTTPDMETRETTEASEAREAGEAKTRVPTIELRLQVDDTANLAVSPNVAAVVVGRVIERTEEETTAASRFGIWQIDVEQPLVGLAGSEQVFLRVQEVYHPPDGPVSVPRFPFTLEQGQRAVFMLTTDCASGLPQRRAVFCLAGQAPGLSGPRTIKDGKVRIYRNGQYLAVPVDEFVERINQLAIEAGRSSLDIQK